MHETVWQVPHLGRGVLSCQEIMSNARHDRSGVRGVCMNKGGVCENALYETE